MIDNPVIWFTLLPLAGYFVGSIPFGVIIARMHGVDIRKVGSGNVGATNVGRVLGRRWGYICFLLDLAKGFLPTALAGVLIGTIRLDKSFLIVLNGDNLPTSTQQGAWLAVGCAAISGHIFNIWLKFRGGKGVATSLGVGLGVFPYFTLPGLVAFGLWIVVTGISRYVSLGSIIGCSMFMPIFISMHYRQVGQLWLFTIFAAMIVVLVNVTHRANIRRLLSGRENKIGSKNKAVASQGDDDGSQADSTA